MTTVFDLLQVFYRWYPDKIEENIVPEVCRRTFEIVVPDIDHDLLGIGKVVLAGRRVHYGAYIESKVTDDQERDDNEEYGAYKAS